MWSQVSQLLVHWRLSPVSRLQSLGEGSTFEATGLAADTLFSLLSEKLCTLPQDT